MQGPLAAQPWRGPIGTADQARAIMAMAGWLYVFLFGVCLGSLFLHLNPERLTPMLLLAALFAAYFVPALLLAVRHSRVAAIVLMAMVGLGSLVAVVSGAYVLAVTPAWRALRPDVLTLSYVVVVLAVYAILVFAAWRAVQAALALPGLIAAERAPPGA